MALALAVTGSFAGNPDRAGSNGGVQLLINPWAKSSGMANASGAVSITGAEAIFTNVAGLAATRKTELIFNQSNYLVGSGISLSAFGFSQKVGESGVIGVSVNTMNFGEVEITTTANPDGGLGTYRLNYSNIGVSYAKAFSNSISGGITFRLISERTASVGLQGAAFDAGIRYVTGKRENVRFGIALKNLGPAIFYKGEGLAQEVILDGNPYTLNQRADKYELPSQLNIGFAYDFLFGETFKLGANANYQSNSFTKDQYMLGVELNLRDRVAIRGGYMIEESGKRSQYNSGITNAWTGIAGGVSLMLPVNKDGGQFSVDYSYRPTNPFNGIHTVGARINL